MRILAVDDDPIIQEILEQFVGAFGDHDLTTAGSAAEALELLRAPAAPVFDCFLFDIQMPEVSGIELIRQVREIALYSDTPVLMLTAMSDKPYVDAAFAAGATDYVTKPFEVTELHGRLKLLENLVEARQMQTRKIFAAAGLSVQKQPRQIELHEPISIYDVDNVIEFTALENYVAQLTRGKLFGSSTFAFTIRNIESFHEHLSAFEYSSLVSDVAEMISDTLANRQFLMAYAGSGTFVCVTESGWRPKMSALMDAINLNLARSELYNNAGQRLEPRVCAGECLRLIWKNSDTIMETVSAAHMSAEAASEAYERRLTDYWDMEKRA